MRVARHPERRYRRVKKGENRTGGQGVAGSNPVIPTNSSTLGEQPGNRRRAIWELIGDGHGAHWPDVDEDISAEGMLSGTPARRSRATRHVRTKPASRAWPPTSRAKANPSRSGVQARLAAERRSARAERHGALLRRRQRRPVDTGTTVKPSWRAASARRSSNTTKGRGSLISRWR